MTIEKVREIDWLKFRPGTLVEVDIDRGPENGIETYKGIVVHLSHAGSLSPQIVIQYERYNGGLWDYEIFNNYSMVDARPIKI